MVKLLQENETRGSLSLREQSWTNERMDFKEELQKLRMESNENKRLLEQEKQWNKQQNNDQQQRLKMIEMDLASKIDDIERYKQLNDKQHRALISQEEKGLFLFFVI
jgi:N-acetylmuramoyl-L-alanine amidase CwlA